MDYYTILNLFEYQEEIQHKFTWAESYSKVQDLLNYLKTKYEAYINYIQIDNLEFLIVFPLEVHSSVCILQFEILLNFEKLTNNFRVILLDQNGIIQVPEKNIRLQLCRYMLRLNSGLRVGSFFVHPLDGYIGLNLQCYNGQENLIYSLKDEFDEFTKYVDSLIQTAIFTMRFHFLRLLILINRINIKQIQIYENYMENKRYEESESKIWRKFSPEIVNLLQRINQTIETNLNEPFNKEQYQNYGPILQKQILCENKVIIEINVNSIDELQVDQTHEVNSGGFSIIYAKDILYTIQKNSQQQNLKKHLIIKKDKNPKDEKIQKEIQILQILSKDKKQQKVYKEEEQYFKFTGTCPYIAQFYYKPDRNDVLLIERYYYSSLDNFQKKMEDCLSLTSKIYIAHSIAMGLRYCHQYEIIHMDIKPANILISKTFVAKITDFGEAIHNNGKQNLEKVGKSMPYCAPEMSKPFGSEQFTYAYDIFSFGVLLFELLFDRIPIDFRIKNQKVLNEKYLHQNYSVRYNEKYEKTLGPQKIMKYLGRLCLACLQPNPKCRPNIDKIILILKDSLSYLDRMY